MKNSLENENYSEKINTMAYNSVITQKEAEDDKLFLMEQRLKKLEDAIPSPLKDSEGYHKAMEDLTKLRVEMLEYRLKMGYTVSAFNCPSPLNVGGSV